MPPRNKKKPVSSDEGSEGLSGEAEPVVSESTSMSLPVASAAWFGGMHGLWCCLAVICPHVNMLQVTSDEDYNGESEDEKPKKRKAPAKKAAPAKKPAAKKKKVAPRMPF